MNKNKSNRLKADYFELLVCQDICSQYSVTFSYSKNIAEISNALLLSQNGKEKMIKQNNNLLKIKKDIKIILDKEIKSKGKIINVRWLGRDFVIENTTSDVDAKHLTERLTRFSVKSIDKGGNGTLKNLGMRSLKKYFNIDFKVETEEMYNKLRQKYLINNLKRIEIKKYCEQDDSRLKFANQNGKTYQNQLNKIISSSFNKSSQIIKLDFLKYITDNIDNDLYVIIANDNGVNVYKPKNKFVFKNDDKIIAKDIGNDGYNIYINNKKYFGVQTCATNKIGISAWCQRIFID